MEASSDSFFAAVAEASRESFAAVASFLVVAAPSSVNSCRGWRLPSAACSGPATTGVGCDGGTEGGRGGRRGRGAVAVGKKGSQGFRF